MGLKSGSRDSGLDDASESAEQDDTPAKAESETTAAGQPSTDMEPQSQESSPETEDDTESKRGDADTAVEAPDSSAPPTVDSIPYKLRRSQVNEGREQVPYFLRQEVIDGEEQLKATLEAELGETVYKSDYREAAMVVAQRQPELIAAVLREWGYDFGTE